MVRQSGWLTGFVNSIPCMGLVIVVFYSISAICVRQLTLLSAPAELSICIRESTAALVILPYVLYGLWRKDIRFGVSWPLVFGGAILMQLFGNLTYFWVFKTAGICVSLCFISFCCLFIALLSDLFFFGEKVKKSTLQALIISLVSVASISWGMHLSGSGQEGSLATGFTVLGILLVLAACFLVGVMNAGTIAVLRECALRQVPWRVLMLLIPGAGTVVLGAISIHHYGFDGIMTALTPQQWSLALTAGVANLIAFSALVWVMNSAQVLYMNIFNSAQIAIGSVAGLWLFHEAPNAFKIIGIALAVLAILRLSFEK